MSGVVAARTYRASCLTCGGDGAHIAEEGLVSEHAVRCVTCGGEGRLEVCEGCGERLEVVAGLEVCGCTVAAELAA